MTQRIRQAGQKDRLTGRWVGESKFKKIRDIAALQDEAAVHVKLPRREAGVQGKSQHAAPITYANCNLRWSGAAA